MTLEISANQQTRLFYKITSLWVICEAFAGGIMHGIKIPFSGMLVSSLSIMCIVLLAWNIPNSKIILKATLIVITFKFTLSPHSPPTAYLAVAFQGVMGWLLFKRKNHFLLSAIVLAILALVESALQRIFVLIILYGSDFWNAIDIYIQKLTGQKKLTNITYWIAIGYLFIHLIFGYFAGKFAAHLAQQSRLWPKQYASYIITIPATELLDLRSRKKKRKTKWLFIFLYILLLLFYVQSLVLPNGSILEGRKALLIIIRSILVLCTWIFIVSPLCIYLLKGYLNRKKKKLQKEFSAIVELLPSLKYIFIKSWELTAHQPLINRLSLFFKILILNTLYLPEAVVEKPKPFSF